MSLESQVLCFIILLHSDLGQVTISLPSIVLICIEVFPETDNLFAAGMSVTVSGNENVHIYKNRCTYIGLPWWLHGKEPDCQCRRCMFNPWAGKIPWRRKWKTAPVYLPGKSHGQRSQRATVHGVAKESDTT